MIYFVSFFAVAERHRLQSRRDAGFTENLKNRMMDILMLLNEGLDHVPRSSEASHHFEVCQPLFYMIACQFTSQF